MCLCVFVCVWCANIKLVKCKYGICLRVHMSVYVPVCGMPLINLVSFGMFANESKSVKCDFFLKIRNFKNIIDRCIISSL